MCWCLCVVERFKETVIEQRKKSVEELLQFVSRYPHLSQSAIFSIFIAVRCSISRRMGSRKWPMRRRRDTILNHKSQVHLSFTTE